MDELKKEMLKKLPKIDEVLLLLEKQNIYDLAPREIVKETCRTVVQKLRDKVVKAFKKEISELSLDAAAVALEVEKSIKGLYRYSLRRVVNATGVILHTNLGRAPLCPEALQRIVEVGRGYSNLEFDLAKGERGQRYDHVSSLNLRPHRSRRCVNRQQQCRGRFAGSQHSGRWKRGNRIARRAHRNRRRIPHSGNHAEKRVQTSRSGHDQPHAS